jgi:putative oxidoreductase
VRALPALLVIVRERLGAIGLALGLLTRVATAGVRVIMIGAIAMLPAQYGFFTNWSGAQGGECFDLHLLALGSSIPLIFRGAGAHSLDQLLAEAGSNLCPELVPW